MSLNSSIARQVDIIPASELISEVEKYSELWDQNLDVYQDKTARVEGWKKVMSAFFPNFEQLRAIEIMEIGMPSNLSIY